MEQEVALRLVIVFLAFVTWVSPSAIAQSQYARTARKGHLQVRMYRTAQAYCHPRLGSNTIRISNDTAVQILRDRSVSCGAQTATLRKVTILQGIHAGESGYFLAGDLSAAPDLKP